MSTTYKCSLCNNRVTVSVPLVTAPTCANPKHKSNAKIMEVVK